MSTFSKLGSRKLGGSESVLLLSIKVLKAWLGSASECRSENWVQTLTWLTMATEPFMLDSLMFIYSLLGKLLYYPHNLCRKFIGILHLVSIIRVLRYGLVSGWYLVIYSLHSKERIQYSKELCCIVRKTSQPIERRLIRVKNCLRRMMFFTMKEYINKLDMNAGELESVPRSESPYDYYNHLTAIHDSG